MKQPNPTLIGVSIATFALASTLLAAPLLARARGAKAPTVPPVAKITPVQAMHAAETKVSGKAKMAIFEFDEGHWIYGVVVVKGHKLMEVDVDPITGKVGDSETVTPADEAKEMQEELAKLLK